MKGILYNVGYPNSEQVHFVKGYPYIRTLQGLWLGTLGVYKGYVRLTHGGTIHLKLPYGYSLKGLGGGVQGLGFRVGEAEL